MRSYVFSMVVLAAAITVPAAQARQRTESESAAGSADVEALVMATTATAIHGNDFASATVQNGASRTIDAMAFTVGVNIHNIGPDAAQGLAYGLDLPAGLNWEAGQTDPDCTFTTSAATCHTSQTILPGNALAYWHVTADAPGTYMINVHATSPTPDPNTGNNSASANIVVQERVRAPAAKVVPSRPKAGSVVTVRVAGITAGGGPVQPTAAGCSGRLGGKSLKGAARTAPGKVTCAYRTPRSAKGRRLSGAVSFTAGQTKIRKRFAVTLR